MKTVEYVKLIAIIIFSSFLLWLAVHAIPNSIKSKDCSEQLYEATLLIQSQNLAIDALVLEIDSLERDNIVKTRMILFLNDQIHGIINSQGNYK